MLNKEFRIQISVLLAVVSISVVAAGCNDSGFEYAHRVGVIQFYSHGIQITLPDSARVGFPFNVKVVTYGGGCHSQGDTKVVADHDSSVITPYDIETVKVPDNFACTAELDLYEHETMLEFDRAGVKRIVIVGRREPEGDEVREVRTVTVK